MCQTMSWSSTKKNAKMLELKDAKSVQKKKRQRLSKMAKQRKAKSNKQVMMNLQIKMK